jgi:hypothetical protein
MANRRYLSDINDYSTKLITLITLNTDSHMKPKLYAELYCQVRFTDDFSVRRQTLLYNLFIIVSYKKTKKKFFKIEFRYRSIE